MNTFIIGRRVLEYAVSVHASATPNYAAKLVSGCLPISSFAVYKADLPCRANAASGWMYLEIHQTVTYFPDLVTTFGERIFNAHWC
jgi:hypothetical protein